MKDISFEEYWNSIQGTIKAILTLENISREAWCKCFHDIFKHSHSLRLYNSTKLLLEERVLQLLSIVETENTANLLDSYYENWQKYCKSIKTLDLLYQNYNRTYQKSLYGHISPAPHKLMKFRDLALDVWKHNMILQLKDSLPKLLIDEINKLRHNIPVTTSLGIIVDVINTFVEVQGSNKSPFEFYNTYFEEIFLNQSREYFKCEALKLTKEFSMFKFSEKVLQFMSDETILSGKLLPEITHPKVQIIFNQQIIIDNFNLIHGEFESMIIEKRFDDMYRAHALLSEANHGLDLFAKVFSEHIEKLGKEIIQFLKPKQIHTHFIEELWNLHEQYKKIVHNQFDDDFKFNKAVDKAFTVIINYKLVETQLSKAPEYLSKYCDMLLNKSCTDIYDHAIIEDKLLKSTAIFMYIDDKDVFQSMYQRQLAQRLILHKSHSLDLEEKMINNLKKAWGYDFTSNLHQMLLDIKVSDGLNAKFTSEPGTAIDDLNISFSTYVLQTKAWPLGLTAASSFVLPEPLKLYAYNFEMFYRKNFNRRKLTWVHQQSWGELKLNYLQKTYIVTLHTIQMSIMLLFEDCDTLKYSEISNALGLTNDQFEKHINGLLGCKLLLFDSDNVTLNWKFSNLKREFRVLRFQLPKKKTRLQGPSNN